MLYYDGKGPLCLHVDGRIAGQHEYYLAPQEHRLMVISDLLRKCVFFVAAGESAESAQPCGSGLFISVPTADSAGVFIYAVTARHCIEGAAKNGDGAVYIKLNRKNAGAVMVKTSASDWTFHETASVDVAAIPFVPKEWMDMKAFFVKSIADREAIDDRRVGIGDEVCAIGLFTHHTGKSKNIPIVRIGHIAAMPEEPVRTNWGGPTEIEAYLIECHSIGGLSGSPVFAYDGFVRRTGDDTVQINLSDLNFRLLGLIHGHWDVDSLIEVAVETISKGADSINAGIAIVVPGTKIIELLNCGKFTSQREALLAEHRQKNLPKLDFDPNQPPQPDGRGERPSDPNALARWIADKTTGRNE